MTTLTEARTTLLQLVNTLPPNSTYAARLAVLSDYFDNQVPLNIENMNLTQRLTRAEAFIEHLRPTWSKDAEELYAKMRAAVPPTYPLRPYVREAGDAAACIAHILNVPGLCACNACRVRASA